MDAAGFLGGLARARVLAATEVIVMRPEQDVLGRRGTVARGRETTDHVTVGFPDALDDDGDLHGDPGHDKAAFGMRIFRVERGLERFQIPAAAGEDGLSDVRADAGRDDVRTGQAAVRVERDQRAGIR